MNKVFFTVCSFVFLTFSLAAQEKPWYSVDTSQVAAKLPGRVKKMSNNTAFITFDGKKDHLAVPQATELPEQFTWLAWIYPEKQQQNGLIICKPGWHNMFYVKSNDKLAFGIFDTKKKSHTFFSYERVQLRQWQLAAVVFDGKSICRYLNDENVLGKLYKDKIFSVKSYYTIGATQPNADSKNRFNGRMNGIRIWHKALPPAEIAKIFADEKKQYGL